MKTVLAFLGLMAVAQGTFDLGLRVRFDATTTYGVTSFMDVPRNTTSAESSGWTETERSESLYSALTMYCIGDYTICTLIDEGTGRVGGLRISIQEDYFSDAAYDWTVQGFSSWTVTVDGTSKTFWYTEQYYLSEETLALSVEEREAACDSTKIICDGVIYVKGFNGELLAISSVYDVFIKDTPFTKQACIPWMGRHFYYKMTSETECSGSTLLPWFPLIHSGEMVGIGLITFGKLTVPSGQTEWFENPSSTAVKTIVTDGPQCLYDLADSPGICTLHIYFIDKVRTSLTCIGQ